MPIYLIDPSRLDSVPRSWNLDATDLETRPIIEDYPRAMAELASGARGLAGIPVARLVGFFDSFADTWLADHPAELRALASFGVAFGLSFLRRANLENLLRASLHSHPSALDGFALADDRSGRHLAALPRGVVTHWLAGNVPAIGWLSLVQGLLTKNANVVKVPQRNGLLLPWFLQRLGTHVFRGPDGASLSGDEVARAVLLVYCPPDDAAGQRALSAASDARVVWGSREAVDAVRALPSQPRVEDIIFGPRVSLAVVAREALGPDQLETLANQLALDASYFDQHGCNAPHTVFVERGGVVDPRLFAAALATAMERALQRVPRTDVTPAEAFRVATARAEWSTLGEVLAPASPDWTVIVTEGQGLPSPVGGRVVFVRPIGQIDDVLPWLDRSCQTVGLATGPDRARRFAAEAARRGVDRIVPPGRMSLYDQPWDGMFMIDRLVRWVALDV